MPQLSNLNENDFNDKPMISLSKSNGVLNYWMVVYAVFAQIATVVITWQLWQIRVTPPNLPLFKLPEFSFGVWVIISLIIMLVNPRRGFVIHVLTMVVASLFDQYRLQPQFLAIIFLMYAAIDQRGLVICRWFLAALWLWAGIHKLVSPHWFSHAGHWMLQSLAFDLDSADRFLWAFAFLVGFAEVITGIVAIFRVKWAAFCCFGMHISIFIILIVIRWNYSVLPWNLATAIVGAWVMFKAASIATGGESERHKNDKWLGAIAATVFLIAPVGFYFGWVDHGYANVLYSDFVPRGLITKKNELHEISGWDKVNVPFPYEHRTLLQYFKSVSKSGDKLHIFDPRPALPDHFYQMIGANAEQISREQFFSTDDSFPGIGIDDRFSKFWLRRWGTISQRWYSKTIDGIPIDKQRDNLISYAFTFDPDFYDREALELLAGLPNLEQLQLAGCDIQDEDLKAISELNRLTGIGLNNTGVTDDGLKYLESLPRLQKIEIEGTQISPGGLKRLQKQLGY